MDLCFITYMNATMKNNMNTMNLLPIDTIQSTALLRVGDKHDLKYCCEISDLGPAFKFRRLYADACDVGFAIVNPKTGDRVTFAVYDTEVDGEGAPTAWIATPTTESLLKHPAARQMTIKLFND